MQPRPWPSERSVEVVRGARQELSHHLLVSAVAEAAAEGTAAYRRPCLCCCCARPEYGHRAARLECRKRRRQLQGQCVSRQENHGLSAKETGPASAKGFELSPGRHGREQ